MPTAAAAAAAAAVAAVAAGAAAAAPAASVGGAASFESSVLFCSTHLYEHFPENPDFDFFPGRGGPLEGAAANRPVGASKTRAPSPAAVAGSSQGAEGSSQGAEGSQEGRSSIPSDLKIGAGGYAQGVASTCPSVLNLPLEPLWVRTSRIKGAAAKESERGRAGFRAAVTEKLLPRLREFAPELLLISAGFDGAAGDDGNAQDDVGGLDLTDDDFRWVTSKLCGAVGKGCPVVSVLEGGYGTWDDGEQTYNRATLASGCAAHVSALCAHVRSL